jgi:hypothetical protein
MKKQDRQGARTVTDLERRYNLGDIPDAVENARIAQRSAEEARSAANEASKVAGTLLSLVHTDDEGVPCLSGSDIKGGVIASKDGTSIVLDLDNGTASLPLMDGRIEAVSAQASYTAMMTDTLIDGTLTKNKISRWYALTLWTALMIENAVVKDVLTADEAAEILG